jgi:hypothetical protein
MQEQKLTRTDKRPLVFTGEEIAADNTKTLNSTRWSKVTVYRTEKGKFVVGLGRITCWQGERDHYSAEVVLSIEEACSYIEEHCPSLAPAIAEKLGVSERI